MSEPRPSPDELRAIAAAMIDDLRASGSVPGIAVGAHAPDFTLPNAVGEPVRLVERLEHGPVVVVFYRGAWCPFCDVYLRSLQEHLPELHARGAALLAVNPQTPDSSLTFAERLGLGFDLLSDLDQSVSTAWRLRFELPEALRQVYRDMGMALDEHNADGSWHLPVPATFVLDRAGVVQARHVDPNYRERMPVADILAALDALDALGRGRP
jgi:peroxiredoxin